jgi:hypothetical protein
MEGDEEIYERTKERKRVEVNIRKKLIPVEF